MYILIFVDQETTEFAHNCTSHHFYSAAKISNTVVKSFVSGY